MLGGYRPFVHDAHRLDISAQVEAGLLLKFVGNPLHDAQIEIVPAEVIVSGGMDHLVETIAGFDDGDVEGAAPEIEHDEDAGKLFVMPIGERGRGRLVEHAHHVQPGNLAGVLGRLPLHAVEVGRHRDDDVVERTAKVALGVGLELSQNERGHRLGRVFAPHHHARITLPHAAFDGSKRFGRMRQQATASLLADDDGAIGQHRYQGWRRRFALLVEDHRRPVAVENRDARIGRSQIDAGARFFHSSPEML